MDTEATKSESMALPQNVEDGILKAVERASGDFLAGFVEKQFEKREGIAEKRFETALAAKQADEDLKEMSGGKNLMGLLAHATLRAGMLNREGKQTNAVAELAKTFGGSEESVAKTLNLQDVSAGGVLVDGDTSERFFDVLRPRVAVLSLGPQIIPMPNRSLSMGGFTADVTATYVGEPNTTEISTEPSTGSRTWNAKTLSALVPISNQMLDSRPGPRIMSFIEDRVRRRLGIRMDNALIRGAGTQHVPLGLTGLASSTPPSAGQTFANVFADFEGVLNTLEGDNVPMTNMGIIWAPRTKNHLMFGARTGGEDIPYHLAEMRQGTFLGMPFATTTEVPVNLGGGSDESEIIVADFDEVIVGEVPGFQVQYSVDGAYTEGGTLVSAFERNEQLLRVIHEHDINVEHTESVVVLDTVQYGA